MFKKLENKVQKFRIKIKSLQGLQRRFKEVQSDLKFRDQQKLETAWKRKKKRLNKSSQSRAMKAHQTVNKKLKAQSYNVI